MPLIEAHAVSYTYPESPHPALTEVSLSVEAGDYLAILGANGSGKSSLLRLLNGQRIPSSGYVRVAGLDAGLAENAALVRKTLCLVFQSPPDQIVSSVVEEDVAFGPENLGLERADIESRVEEALAAVGLLEERRRPTHALSAGQQQRLAIAGALAMRPACVAFDEATSMLDPPSREAVLRIMDELVARGVAVIHVTHDMAEAARAARVLVLSAGRVAFEGTPDELFSAADGRTQPPALTLGLGLPPAAHAARVLGLAPRAREDASGLAARLLAEHPEIRYAALPARTADVSDDSPIGQIPAAASPFPAFAAEDLAYAYLHGTLNETEALRGVSFSLDRGMSLALVGRTGSGKSTLLQLLDALARPASGRLKALGVAVPARQDAARRDARGKGGAPLLGRRRAYKAAVAEDELLRLRTRAPLSVQRPETALFERYAGDDVAFGPRNLGLFGAALVTRVRRAMDEVGLPFEAFRDRPIRALSGGEKRKLALAGVLALEPEALLLDEPTSALDPETRSAVLRVIGARRASGSTVVMATHSMEEAALADRIAVFARGRLVAFGSPRSLFYESYDPSWGVARPFAVELALALAAGGCGLLVQGARPLFPEEIAAVISSVTAADGAEGLR